MTIQNRELNRRLSYLEHCADVAPEGTYQEAKDTVDAIREIVEFAHDELRRHTDLMIANDDRVRNFEVALYEFILSANPDRFHSAEGFGEHVQGPAGARVMAQLISDRDQLKALRG